MGRDRLLGQEVRVDAVSRETQVEALGDYMQCGNGIERNVLAMVWAEIPPFGRRLFWDKEGGEQQVGRILQHGRDLGKRIDQVLENFECSQQFKSNSGLRLEMLCEEILRNRGLANRNRSPGPA